ncbi:hypothetical protein [Spirosoma validum]|uniref:Uncharacterized protein n=1 Tax=Spirosoma validum TaxID=2771355 RepID=A0A927B8P4_9BACT|nr:hypothetical protein [Spirosoma validum]MBD2757308.1 hypothetical protein [Spirosoma validum]
MDDIFNFLNSTFEAGQSILDGKGRIIGYANDGGSISGVLSLGSDQIKYQIDPSMSPGDMRKYSLTLERTGQTVVQEHLYAKEIIHILKTGDLPIFQTA